LKLLNNKKNSYRNCNHKSKEVKVISKVLKISSNKILKEVQVEVYKMQRS